MKGGAKKKVKARHPALPSKGAMEASFDGLRFCSCQYADGPVGLTYISFGPDGAKCHTDVRGGWPTYISNQATNTKQVVDGICITGGSALGLEAVSGILAEAWKKEHDIKGINAAVIWSHNLAENEVYPDKALGEFAYHNLSTALYSGQVGAGCSASKGQGVCFGQTADGYNVLCIVVNNAICDVFDREGRQLTNCGDHSKASVGRQTTITTVVTDLDLDNDELQQLSHQLHASMAESIRPFNTLLDGDVLYACSTRSKKKHNLKDNYRLVDVFSEMAEILKEAVVDSVQ